MNFQQLEYCVAVDRLKHFGKAAESCNITQATLSGMIKKLEDELGVLLFDRSKHPIQTTEDGNDFIKITEQLLKLKNELFAISSQKMENLKGILKVGVIPTVANSLLPLVLKPILIQNPELELNISEITTEEILQQLASDQIDLGILSTPLPDLSYYVEQEVLYYEPMLVYGIKNVEKKEITIDELKNDHVWLLEEGHCFRNQSMAICNLNDDKKHKSNLNFKGNSFETLLNLSDQFGGYTLIPELFYKGMNEQRKSITKSFSRPTPVREISMISLRPMAKKKSMSFLADLIREEVAAVLPGSLQKVDRQVVEM
jgi:LysR family hydrogen peroxide-inducible transcriptional activator